MRWPSRCGTSARARPASRPEVLQARLRGLGERGGGPFIVPQAIGSLVPGALGESALRRRQGRSRSSPSAVQGFRSWHSRVSPVQDREPSRFLRATGAVVLLFLVLWPALSLGAAAAPASRIGSPAVALGAVRAEHPTRVRILAYLEAVPGDHFSSIARGVHVSRAEARHHLNVLMKRGQVREVRHCGRLRYYANEGSSADRNATFGAYWEMRECRVRVLRFVQARTVAGPSNVAAGLGISRQLADYHLQHLAASGLLRRDRGAYRA